MNEIDYGMIADALNNLPETELPRARRLKNRLADPRVLEAVKRAKANGHKARAIVAALIPNDLEITEVDFNATWNRIKQQAD